MSDLSRKEMTQEILDTLLMVENELFFGGNHEDAKARIDRCRSHLKEAQIAQPSGFPFILTDEQKEAHKAYLESLAKPDERLGEKVKEMARQFYWFAREHPERGKTLNLETLTEGFAKEIQALLPDIRREGRQDVIDWIIEHDIKDKFGNVYVPKSEWQAKLKEWGE